VSSCQSCGGEATDAYRLPGGDVVHADDVPFTNGPRGVTAIQVCRKCGAELTEADDR